MYFRYFHLTKRFIAVAIAFFVLFPSITFGAGLDLVNITTTPKTPVAGKSVTIEIESYAIDLTTANIAWMVNGEFKEDGIAKREITLITPDFGEKTTVDIIILTKQGDKIDKQYIIAPAELDVLWEAQTYTPPFYKGKALPSFNSLVRITAIPRFNSLTSDPSLFFYKWTYNRVSGAGEALGKNSVTIPMGFTNSNLQVIADVSLDGTPWKGHESIDIAVASPKIVLFENDPLLGIQLDHPLKPGESLSSKETEVNIFAAPYFFSLDDLLNNHLVYTWEINRRYVSPGLFPRYLTLVKPENIPTTYAVSLRIQNPKRILQEGRTKVDITFNAK